MQSQCSLTNNAILQISVQRGAARIARADTLDFKKALQFPSLRKGIRDMYSFTSSRVRFLKECGLERSLPRLKTRSRDSKYTCNKQFDPKG